MPSDSISISRSPSSVRTMWLSPEGMSASSARQADPADARSLGSRTNFISAPPGSPSGA